MTAPIFGLVLAGGRSTRMGRDKAGLQFEGRTQLSRAFGLLSALTTRCFVSVRADQREDPLRAGFAQVIDLPNGPAGPIGGIRAAQLAHPEAAWLVLACDLPLLDAATLQHLIARRDPGRTATAFRSRHDGLPEPLCAIWEPASAGALAAAIATGRTCPRKFLIESDTLLLDLPHHNSLDNVNTPQELAAANAAANAPAVSVPRELRVQYFALLREQAGRRDETLLTHAANPRELYAELAARHHFSLTPEHLKVAVNAEFSDWSRPLAGGDSVVFIPPGGRWMSAFRFAHAPIDTGPLRAELLDTQCGGFTAFEGWVRDHNEGQQVTRLEYEAFEALGVREGERIMQEARERFGITRVLCVHRLGSLALTDIAVWVGAASAHRDEAFKACRYIIDEVKHRVPIWKKEHYGSGDSGWVNCERCATHAHDHDHGHAHGHDHGP